MTTNKRGIDVSQWNGQIDWSKVIADFVYIRAGVGIGAPDARLLENVHGAASRGIPFGFYHFPSFNSLDVVKDSTAEAQYFLNLTKPFNAILPPILDIENDAIKPNVTLSKEQIEQWALTFLHVLEAAGHKPWLYSYPAFLDAHLPMDHQLHKYPLWAATYPWDKMKAPQPPVSAQFPADVEKYLHKVRVPWGWRKIDMWQFTGQGIVNGVKSYCDINVKYE